MATLRGSASSYDVGNRPPNVNWTVVRGDTAAFRVYVTDDQKLPLNIPDWDIAMQVKRPNNVADLGVLTDNAEIILNLLPISDPDDAAGEFTVSLTSAQSTLLESGDIFDIQLSTDQNQFVWTVAQGKMIIIEDVTS